VFHHDGAAGIEDTGCMFDVATRPQPKTADASRAAAVPFDWRLVTPGPAVNYSWKDFLQPDGVPVVYADVLATYSVELEDTLQTAVIISLFTDRRAGADDKLPVGHVDRRGWVGEEFAADGFDTRSDPWGSLLWTCYGGKSSQELLERARFAAFEALEWMVRAGVASRVEVTAQWVGERQDRLAVRPAIYKPGQVAPVYDVLWGTSIRRLAQ
jgi:phage gp46-like protein